MPGLRRRRRFFRRKKKVPKSKALTKKVNELWNSTIPEYKFYTTVITNGGTGLMTQTALNTGTGAQITNLFPVGTRGTGVNQFIGDQVLVHMIQIRLHIRNGNFGQPVRFIMFKNNAGTLEAPLPAYILADSITQTDLWVSQDISPLNPDYFKTPGLKHMPAKRDFRYELIYDKMLDPSVLGGDHVWVKTFKFKKPVLITQSTANVIKGATICTFIPHGFSTTAANNPLMAGEATVYYTDL